MEFFTPSEARFRLNRELGHFFPFKEVWSFSGEGYPDGTIQPSRPISRAETIIMLDRAIGTLYNAAGTYSPSDGKNTLSGNVTINTSGVTLQNTVIEGSLYLTAGIGDGNVYINNIVVKGKTIVAGGGKNSIHFTNFTCGEIIVIKT